MKTLEHYGEKIQNNDKEKRGIEVKSLIYIIAKIAPNFISEKLSKIISNQNSSMLPFDPNKFNFDFREEEGRGAEHRVFLLESIDNENPSYVLKIYYKSRGDVKNISETAKKFRKEFEDAKKIYADVPGLIPDEMTMIISHPEDNKPVIATVQKFFGRNLRDVLNFSKDQLISIFEDNPKLKNDLIKFYEITKRRYDKGEYIADIVGADNLSLVKTEDGYSLILLDPHNLMTNKEDFYRWEKIKNYLDNLEKVINYVDIQK